MIGYVRLALYSLLVYVNKKVNSKKQQLQQIDKYKIINFWCVLSSVRNKQVVAGFLYLLGEV